MTAELFAVWWCVAVEVAVTALLAVMVRSDLRSRRIPNGAVLGLALSWAALHLGLLLAGIPAEGLLVTAQAQGIPGWALGFFRPASVGQGLLAAVVAGAVLMGAGLLYERISGKTGMGAGDVKLIAALGLFAGPSRLMVAVMVACAVALATSLVTRSRTFPFAPALAIGFVCVMSIEL